ncbi:MAG: hypothetical protein CTY19_04060 [Methylomonas sp.]|nr:MAG: hypothetical protein CTY19_04060 [Methylomonas sp.]
MRWLLMWLLMTAQPVHAEFNPQSVVMNCLICHDSEKNSSSGEVPDLAGLTSAELHQALLDFKYDRRFATLMPRIAKGYSDAEIQAVADWLSQ